MQTTNHWCRDDNAGQLWIDASNGVGDYRQAYYSFDKSGRTTQVKYPDNSSADMNYTTRGQTNEVDFWHQPTSAFTNNLVDFDYDEGREIERLFANSYKNTRSYAGRLDGLPSAVNLSKSGTSDTGASFAYTYDSNKNPTGETVGSPMAAYSWATGTTGYDAEDRLVNFDRTGTANDQTWTLTKAGDWDDTTRGGTTEDGSHSAAHKITSLSPGTTPTYDLKGNILTDGTRTYTWDFDNLLTQIAVTGGPTITFRYDVLGRRLFRISTPAMGSATTTRYILRSQSEGGQTLAEEDNASGTYRLYVWGNYVDDLLARIKSDGTRHTFHANRMFSVAAVSDSTGNVAERYAYTAYGEPIITNASGTTIASSAIGNNTLFTGREWDPEAGIYYYRARYYDPKMGRFLGRDPIEYEGGVNLYSFIYGAPLGLVDPTGTDLYHLNASNGSGSFIVNVNITHTLKNKIYYFRSLYEVVFEPKKDECGCNEISFIQSVKTEKHKHNLGKLDGDASVYGRRTGPNGYRIDQLADHNSPWYPYDNSDQLERNKYGQTTHGEAGNTIEPKQATLFDTPSFIVPWSWQQRGPQAHTSMSFNTCAICKNGRDSGKIYGCISWGFRGLSNSSTFSSQPREKSEPSPGFKEAVKAWNKAASNGGGEIPIPELSPY